MSSTLRTIPVTMRRLAAWHPEWWMLAGSVAAWCWLLLPRHGLCCPCQAGFSESALSGWVLMVSAMMLPMMVIPVRAAAFGSLWRRRHLAIGIFLVGYIGVWTAAGAANLAILDFLHRAHAVESGWVIGGSFLAAAAWQYSAIKRRVTHACHRTRPLAPSGWRANRDCLAFGFGHGIYCVENCGILMLAAMLSPWPRLIMLTATALLLYERYLARPRDRVVPVMLIILAMAHCFLAETNSSGIEGSTRANIVSFRKPC